VDAPVSSRITLPGQEEDPLGPERLFAILEEAVPRPDDTVLLTTDDLQKRREGIERAWDQVRRWLWAHVSQEERAEAAYIRGQAEVTPLHLMCKLNNPPADIVSDIVQAAPEVCGWADAHGWLPLHHACANGASTEVLQVLTTANPDSKVVQDNQNRTPLHFYATRNADNPNAMAANVELLSDTGAAELTDRNGMLPMHYACAYGTTPLVLRVLANAYPESLFAKENKGRTPMHLAMVNAHRDASPGVLSFLIENEGQKTVNTRDHEGNLPLHLLNLGLKGLSSNEPEKMHNVRECLKIYLAATPQASPDFLAALQDLPEWLQEVAVVSPHVRNILNKKIIQRFPTAILLMDGYMLLTIIICFEMVTTVHIDFRFQDVAMNATNATIPPNTDDLRPDNIGDAEPLLGVLFLGAAYFLLREAMQIAALWSLGAVTSWFYDTTNWLDVTVILLVSYYSILMKIITVNQGEYFQVVNGTLTFDEDLVPPGAERLNRDTFRAGCAFTKGVLWMAVIFFLKSTSVDFAVFLGGVFYVVQRLVAFLLAVGVILLAFAQMFFIAYQQQDVCTMQSKIQEDNPECQFPHCKFLHSLLKCYTMMMGEIGSESRYDGYLLAQVLYVAYAFLVVILLSNVLIAIVTDSYEIIQNDRAAIVFWSNRLDFVAEMDGIASVFKQRILCIRDTTPRGVPGAPMRVQEGPNGTIALEGDDAHVGSKNVFGEAWKSIMYLFESNFYDDVDLSPKKLEFWVYLCYQGLALIIIPIWIALGIFSFGILWPPQVREFLFVQKETSISRAEIERQKLDQLKEIQGDIKALKTEIRKEMVGDREDMIRMKAEVEAVQSEVLADLQQVRELMITILDIGGMSQDR